MTCHALASFFSSRIFQLTFRSGNHNGPLIQCITQAYKGTYDTRPDPVIKVLAYLPFPLSIYRQITEANIARTATCSGEPKPELTFPLSQVGPLRLDLALSGSFQHGRPIILPYCCYASALLAVSGCTPCHRSRLLTHFEPHGASIRPLL